MSQIVHWLHKFEGCIARSPARLACALVSPFPLQDQCLGGGSQGEHLPAWHCGGRGCILLPLAWTPWQLQTDTFWQFQWVLWQLILFLFVSWVKMNSWQSSWGKKKNMLKGFVLSQDMGWNKFTVIFGQNVRCHQQYLCFLSIFVNNRS